MDFVAILVVCLFPFYGSLGAGAFALGQGLLTDLLSAGFGGLFTLQYLFILGSVSLGSVFFDMRDTKGFLSVVFFACLAGRMLHVALLAVFFSKDALSGRFLWGGVASAAASALLGVLFLYFLLGVGKVFGIRAMNGRREDSLG